MSRPGRPGQSCACGALIKAWNEIKSEGLTGNCKIPGGEARGACRGAGRSGAWWTEGVVGKCRRCAGEPMWPGGLHWMALAHA